MWNLALIYGESVAAMQGLCTHDDMLGQHQGPNMCVLDVQVGVEYNAGFSAALAALNEDTTPWTLCLQRNGRAMWS